METKQVIVVRKDLNMRKGKLAAQVAHASMAFLTHQLRHEPGEANEYGCYRYEIWLQSRTREWLNSSFAKVVVSVDSEEELRDLIAQAREALITVHEIIDSGRTEFHGVPTLTCAAFGPDIPAKLDPITGQLKLL